jgi:hypothetical protein
MPGGRKAKKSKHDRNISGLKNQFKNLPSHSDSTPHPTPPRSQAPSPELSEVEDELLEMGNDYELLNHFDSLKADFEQEDHDEEYWSDDDGEDDGDIMMDEWCKDSEDLTESMVMMMREDDLNDLDWMPEKLKNKITKRKEKGKGECLLA